jgi:phosphate transport system protein
VDDKEHTSSEFQRELRDLREQLLGMARIVAGQVEHAVGAVVKRDAVGAQQVIAKDGAIDESENAIDELALLIVARRQPVASDLRFIMLALKVVTDLERIGDMAVNIAKRVGELTELPPEPFDRRIEELSRRVQGALQLAIDAYVEADATRAAQVIAGDIEIDALNSALFADILGAAKDGSGVSSALALSSVSRYLERVGDHATNIAEMVIYALRGQTVRHRANAP